MEFPARECAREGCDIIFVPKAHNGIYHSVECRQIATNAKVLARYYESKDKKKAATKRTCKTKTCKTVLSQYNKDDICESCKNKKLKSRLKKWGWAEDDIERKVDALGF